jgi:hypothetical protein
MATAKAHGQLIEPQDVAAFPHLKAASPGGVLYIGRIEVLDVASGTVLNVVTHGGVARTFTVAVGQVIDGPIRDIAAGTTIDSCRVWYLSAV